MQIHDPREFVRGLQQILVSDSKRIGFLSGAGTSMVFEKPQGQDKEGNQKFDSLIPGTKSMTKTVVDSFSGKELMAIKQIETELTTEGNLFHIENLISKITQKEAVVGNEKLCNLTKVELIALKEEIENKIKSLISIHKEAGFQDWDITHYKFAQWIHDATRKNCVEVFTTNYDYLFEIAFEKYNIPYFDGFIGAYSPFFHSGSLEDDGLLKGWTKLWKLHGSLGWEHNVVTNKIVRGNKDSGKIMIYPSILKYNNSKKQPYVSFMDRLSRFVRTEDTVLFISGYSFGDQHINDNILNALAKSKTSSAIAFVFDNFEEDSDIAKLAKEERRLSVYGKRNAVIGGRFGKWALKSMPADEDDIHISTYFDQDAVPPIGENGIEGSLPSVFEGDFKLVDFSKLVQFLSDLNYSSYGTKSKK